MPCTKQELVQSINSYAAARVSGDDKLIAMSAQLVQATVDSLEFSPEPETLGATEAQVE